MCLDPAEIDTVRRILAEVEEISSLVGTNQKGTPGNTTARNAALAKVNMLVMGEWQTNKFLQRLEGKCHWQPSPSAIWLEFKTLWKQEENTTSWKKSAREVLQLAARMREVLSTLTAGPRVTIQRGILAKIQKKAKLFQSYFNNWAQRSPQEQNQLTTTINDELTDADFSKLKLLCEQFPDKLPMSAWQTWEQFVATWAHGNGNTATCYQLIARLVETIGYVKLD
jgi:hypothetical protein